MPVLNPAVACRRGADRTRRARAGACPRRFPFAIVLVAAFGSAGPLAAAPALTLDEAMRSAVAQAPALHGRRAMERASEAEAARAPAFPDPRLSVAVDDVALGGRAAGRMGGIMATTWRVGVMQDLPARGKRQARRQLAEARTRSAHSATEAESLAVARAAADAWIERWHAESTLALLGELRDEAERAVGIVEARLQAGADTVGDALGAHAARLELDNRIDEARAALAAARAGLARWLGEEAAARPLSQPDFMRLPVPAERLFERIDEQADLVRWSRREAEAAATLRLASLQRRPDWRVGLSYGVRDSGQPDVLMLEVGVDLPIAPGNRQDREVAARQHELEAVRAGFEDALRARHALLRQTLAEWRGRGEQAARYRDALLPLARDRSAVALAAYGGGAPLQPWLDARRDEIELRLAYAATLAAQGRGWALLATVVSSEATP